MREYTCFIILSNVNVVQALMGEDATKSNVSRKNSLVMGARHHLEFGHEKYIVDTIQSHPAQVINHGLVVFCSLLVAFFYPQNVIALRLLLIFSGFFFFFGHVDHNMLIGTFLLCSPCLLSDSDHIMYG